MRKNVLLYKPFFQNIRQRQFLMDAITALFAVFNHNLNLDDARKTLAQLKSHLKQDGVLIFDLYNPQSSGEKTSSYEGISKIMK